MNVLYLVVFSVILQLSVWSYSNLFHHFKKDEQYIIEKS